MVGLKLKALPDLVTWLASLEMTQVSRVRIARSIFRTLSFDPELHPPVISPHVFPVDPWLHPMPTRLHLSELDAVRILGQVRTHRHRNLAIGSLGFNQKKYAKIV